MGVLFCLDWVQVAVLGLLVVVAVLLVFWLCFIAETKCRPEVDNFLDC